MLRLLMALFFLLPFSVYAAQEVETLDVFVYTNLERHHEGMSFVKRNTQLDAIAELKARDILSRQYFAHESPSGEYAHDIADRIGYSHVSIAENLALGTFENGREVVDAWMASKGHKENILTPSFREIGIAAVWGEYEKDSVWVVVQIFGIPESVCPLPDSKKERNVGILERALAVLRGAVGERETRFLSAPRNAEWRVAYIEAVHTYNKYVAQQRETAAAYNKEVEVYNACLAALQ